MDKNIAAKATELAEIGKRIGKDQELRLRLNRDPLAFLKTLGVEVESEFADVVERNLRALSSGPGAIVPAAVPHPFSSAKASAFLQETAASTGERGAPITRAAPQAGEVKFGFRTNIWGLVLDVPEQQVQLITGGYLTLAELNGALMAGLGALAGAAGACPPLAAVLAVSGLFCGVVAPWMLAEAIVIRVVDSIYHKGVCLTWTWIGLALTCYIPITAPIR